MKTNEQTNNLIDEICGTDLLAAVILQTVETDTGEETDKLLTALMVSEGRTSNE